MAASLRCTNFESFLLSTYERNFINLIAVFVESLCWPDLIGFAYKLLNSERLERGFELKLGFESHLDIKLNKLKKKNFNFLINRVA